MSLQYANAQQSQLLLWVLAGSYTIRSAENGAKALSLHFSLLRTAKLHGHEPYRYYVRVLKAIAYAAGI